MKTGIRAIFAVLGIAGGVTLGIGGFCFNSHSIEAGANADWMKDIADDRTIASMYIPGSHDALASYSIADFAGKCQDLDLASQLNAGARFLDLRYEISGSELKSMHGFIEQRTTFASDVKRIEAFLKDHPREFVLVSIKEENKKEGAVSFEDAILDKIDLSLWDLSSSLPSTLGEARGKAYLLSRYDDPSVGINASPSLWSDNATFDIGDIHIQDVYKLSSVDEKKAAIEGSFDGNEGLHLHFYSAYLSGAFPIQAAITAAKEINPWVGEAVKLDHANGIAIVDFMTTSIGSAIIGRN